MVRLRIAAVLLAALCACAQPPAGELASRSIPAAPTVARPSPSVVATLAATASATTADEYVGIPERVATTPFPTVALPARPAPNFAFSFGYGSCRITRIVSTFDGTLTQVNLEGRASMVRLELDDAELERIYDEMVAIAFFSYPERYSTILSDTMVRVMATPHPGYEFRVRHGELEKQVLFADSVFRPTTTETDNLRRLVTLITSIVEAQPELAQLPPLKESCA